ncbi:MAG: 50S ribosomal protein L17 [Candidatus Uhrbacteria bacterium]
MRHRKSKITLSRRSGARAQLLCNLAVSVILHERVRTTAAKARAVRPLVERCIAAGRENTMVRRRSLIATLGDERAVRKIIEVLGPRYAARHGGCTRLTRLGRRAGDAAEIVAVEFV